MKHYYVTTMTDDPAHILAIGTRLVVPGGHSAILNTVPRPDYTEEQAQQVVNWLNERTAMLQKPLRIIGGPRHGCNRAARLD